MINIKKLEWDSVFFGYEIAKLESNFIESELIKLPYKLIYIFSIKAIEQKSIVDADSKVEMEKTQLIKNDNFLVRFSDKEHSFDELLDLVYLSGKYSRFKTDINFRNNEFERMYYHWIKNAVSNPETNVFVKVVDKKLAGFVLLSFEKEFGRIDLIAVGENYQKKGIGKELIQAAETICILKGLSIIKVATQGKNLNALNLYQKNGFKIVEKQYIYHYWNN
jgi:dTDP-4-amino-4,6-dideoxy-D-galactose acyltransferase